MKQKRQDIQQDTWNSDEIHTNMLKKIIVSASSAAVLSASSSLSSCLFVLRFISFPIIIWFEDILTELPSMKKQPLSCKMTGGPVHVAGTVEYSRILRLGIPEMRPVQQIELRIYWRSNKWDLHRSSKLPCWLPHWPPQWHPRSVVSPGNYVVWTGQALRLPCGVRESSAWRWSRNQGIGRSWKHFGHLLRMTRIEKNSGTLW